MEGSIIGVILEVILTHLFVTVVPAHAFDARICKVLTRVKELGAAFAINQLAHFGGEGRSPPYDVNCCSAFFQISFSGSVDGSLESALLAIVGGHQIWGKLRIF